MPAEPHASRQVLSIERGLRCLAALGRRGGEGTFTILQQASGHLPDPTMARLLRSLIAAGLIENLGRGAGYRLTELSRSMARSILQQDDLASLCRPMVHKLAQECGMSTGVFVPCEGTLRMLVKTEIPEGVHLLPEGGRRAHIGGHGAAQVLAAYDGELRRRWRGGPRRDLGLPGGAFPQRMQDIRRLGLHVGYGEEVSGDDELRQRLLLRISLPLRAGEEGPALAALCLSAHTDRPDAIATPRLQRHLKRMAESLSAELAMIAAPS